LTYRFEKNVVITDGEPVSCGKIGFSFGTPICGDNSCNGSETVNNCPQDCSVCGDGQCTGNENNSNCCTDCGTCADCGDGNIDSGEQCDSGNLGGQTCQGLGFDSGTLGCKSNCTFDTSSCTDGSIGNTITLLPNADTFLNINNANYSSRGQINLHTWPSNTISNVILMQFDLSSIPNGSTIQNATLNLSLIGSDSYADPTYTVSAHKIINVNPDLSLATGETYDGVNSWIPNSCCYNNFPLAQSDISAAYDTQEVDKTIEFKTWDLTEMVQEWVNTPTINYGLLLNADNTASENSYRYFTSSETGVTALKPYLEVTYTAVANNTGDLNGDGVVDIFDLVIVGSNFHTTVGPDHQADANGDEECNIVDLQIVALNFGTEY